QSLPPRHALQLRLPVHSGRPYHTRDPLPCPARRSPLSGRSSGASADRASERIDDSKGHSGEQSDQTSPARLWLSRQGKAVPSIPIQHARIGRECNANETKRKGKPE